MAAAKKSSKLKEPVRVRTKKLANGSESYYLDIYVDGKRSYEFLKMYHLPEVNAPSRSRTAPPVRRSRLSSRNAL